MSRKGIQVVGASDAIIKINGVKSMADQYQGRTASHVGYAVRTVNRQKGTHSVPYTPYSYEA